MHHRTGGGAGMQEVIQMCSSFDANKSTKGASKLRRDLINAEIANLRDLLPLPSSTRQRLSQLQLMALVCVYVRKANYFQQVFKRHHELGHPYNIPNIGFSKALSGFLIMMTQNGKLLYISDNAAEYLGHSMEDLLIHGDSVYDIIDKADHGTVQAELLRSTTVTPGPVPEESRLFLCRMNVSRNARRQMRFGDQKVVLLQGHYLSYLPLCSRNEPVFVATCTPVAMPETRECVVQGATNVFTTIHAMDMKFMHVDRNGEYYLGYTRSELGGISWYQLIHWNFMREAQSKHRLISQSEQEKSCILLLRLQTRAGDWIWIHCVLQVKDGQETAGQNAQAQSVIVATNQVLSEREASVMRANSWIYHYYTVQTKLQYGLAYPEAAGSPTAAAAAARLAAAAAYFPSTQLINYGSHHMQSHGQGPHGMVGQGDGSGGGAYGATVIPPNLHSPHNGSYTPTYHHPHPHHVMDITSAASSGKESPLDFSLAASSSVFDYTGYGPPTYWPHHPHSHHYHHPGNNHQQPPLSHHHHHPHSYLNVNQRLVDPAGSMSSGVGVSAGSPQTNHHWSSSGIGTHGANGGSSGSNSSHHHHTSHQQQPPPMHHANTTLSPNSGANLSPSVNNTSTIPSTNLSPVSNNTNNSSSRGNKRFKKNVESESSLSPPARVGGGGGGGYNVEQPGGGSSAPGSDNSNSEVLAMSTPFPYHHAARHRTMFKMIGSSGGASVISCTTPSTSEDEHSSSVKDETVAISCPLTPSPIWEGQTQRVPDLGFYQGNNGTTVIGTGNGDLIHCVPTYQPISYHPFYASSSLGTSLTPGGGNLGGAMIHPHGSHHLISQTSSLIHLSGESGSPNKENRLPPTPESEHETEDSRGIKWETL